MPSTEQQGADKASSSEAAAAHGRHERSLPDQIADKRAELDNELRLRDNYDRASDGRIKRLNRELDELTAQPNSPPQTPSPDQPTPAAQAPVRPAPATPADYAQPSLWDKAKALGRDILNDKR